MEARKIWTDKQLVWHRVARSPIMLTLVMIEYWPGHQHNFICHGKIFVRLSTTLVARIWIFVTKLVLTTPYRTSLPTLKCLQTYKSTLYAFRYATFSNTQLYIINHLETLLQSSSAPCKITYLSMSDREITPFSLFSSSITTNLWTRDFRIVSKMESSLSSSLHV